MEWLLTREAVLDCETNSPYQHLRKCKKIGIENMRTDVGCKGLKINCPAKGMWCKWQKNFEFTVTVCTLGFGVSTAAIQCSGMAPGDSCISSVHIFCLLVWTLSWNILYLYTMLVAMLVSPNFISLLMK